MRRIAIMRRSAAVFLSVFLLAYLLLPLGAQPVRGAPQELIIHYQREDDAYDGWSVWAWPENQEGADIPFSDEDAFGKIARVPVGAGVERMGFLIRTQDWAKDIAEDRYVDLSEGTEIWVTSGQAEFTYDNPLGGATAKNYDTNQIKIHYRYYDRKLPENLTIQFYTKEQPDNRMEKKFEPGMTISVPATDQVFFSLKKGEEYFDYQEGKIKTTTADENGHLEVYLMQSTNKVSTQERAFPTEKTLLKADLVAMNAIAVELSIPKNQEESGDELRLFELQDANNKLVELDSFEFFKPEKSLFPKTNRQESYDGIVLKTKNALDLTQPYTLQMKEYGSRKTALHWKMFDTPEFEEQMTYTGDLGALYQKNKTTFKVWAPTALAGEVRLYDKGENTKEAPKSTHPLVRTENGTMTAEVEGDLHGVYYTYQFEFQDQVTETVDLYAKAAGVNGERGMVVDLERTNPDGFRSHEIPMLVHPNESIIYEIHVRDLSMHENSGIKNKGKFLGFTETGTKNTAGESTGVDHIKELGATHVHLLPVFDFKTIDEAKLSEKRFNWGYDPQNYNVPEGSYATDPYHGEVRINEFKQMVQALHENDLRVVMDVVYNHTFTASDSAFSQTVPGYYYRMKGETLSDGSACGNETASERAMMRKFIVDSVVYWAKEYRVDGFRFDLMGLHDIDTMNAVREALNEIDPSIIVYGEGWTGGDTPLAPSRQALKKNVPLLDVNIAAFSDDIRDGIKGSVFIEEEYGFVNTPKDQQSGREEDVKFGIVGAVKHPDVNIAKVQYSDDFWALEPSQAITYASAHDNLSLWDKLVASTTDLPQEDLVKMNRLSAAIVLSSQGISFFQAGEEMARSKDGNENSYNSPDAINRINWDNKTEFSDLYQYYRGLIELRKTYPAFRMTSADDIRSQLSFVATEESLIAYTVADKNAKDYQKFAVVFNGSFEEKEVTLEANAWDVLVDEQTAGATSLRTIAGGTIKVPAKSALVLGENPTASPSAIRKSGATQSGSRALKTALAIVGGALAVGSLLWLRHRNKKRDH